MGFNSGFKGLNKTGEIQGRKIRYSVTFRGFRLITVSMEKQSVFNITSVSVFLYLSCAILYCHIWPARL